MSNYIKKIKLLLFLGTPIYAGHPLTTDDALSVGRSNLEAEIVSEFLLDNAYNEIGFPVSVTYGLSNNIDFAFSVPFFVTWGNDKSYNGFGDFLMELKYIHNINEFKIGLKPYLSLPNGDEEKGFGTGKVRYGISFLFTKEWESVHLHSEVGYTKNNNSVNQKVDLWNYSIAAEKFLTNNFSLVIEFGLSKYCCFDASGNSKFLLGGFIYYLEKNISLDIGLSKGLNKSATDYIILTGLTLVI